MGRIFPRCLRFRYYHTRFLQVILATANRKPLAVKRVDFISPAARLEDALKQLEAAWMETREHWDDSISQKVQDEFLMPVHGQIRTMMDAVSKMSLKMRKAEQDCLHPRERNVTM